MGDGAVTCLFLPRTLPRGSFDIFPVPLASGRGADPMCNVQFTT
jgi:hypothetical protein